ncbi:DUF262 domain-containing protein [Sphingomonas sp. Leaf62]|uniref:DUF262 domain-containing protein n=1 Tax=Sphingomonas sp. Leaf62 TaxID=1736228 RepID=UPI0007142449|nr:DUF262 domain-containing protein [Sphingomonas sp. Leaf62]KQN80102.1 hypothetical protein ASE91_12790 [Sphingomonas sp. Leaf62]
MSYVDTSMLKNSTIMLLYSEQDEILTDPPYQRMGGVWNIEKKRLLIDSILNDYDIPKIYFHAYVRPELTELGFKYAIIDGRQRLEAIWQFMDDKFRLSNDFEYQRDTSVNLAGLSYGDIAKRYPKIRIKFDSFVLPVVTVTIANDDLDLIEDMFSRLNEAVPLNAAEKRNAIGGHVVRAINAVSNHPFFVENVKFSNSRYQHKEVAARFLLVEDSLATHGRIVDTKKIFLDALAKRYRVRGEPYIEDIKNKVSLVLDEMYAEFSLSDELLAAQGSMVVYYLIFRNALDMGESNKVSRRGLLDFRKELAENRKRAENDLESSFQLLEFDRLNQQGTNDASSIKERVAIMSAWLNLSKTDVS